VRWRALWLVGVLVVGSVAAETLLKWRHNTRAFAWDNFKFEPDQWQGEAFDAFDDPTKARISLQACAGPGKTAVEAICGWKFLSCYGDRYEHPKGAATAITDQNLHDNLWAEFSKWQQRSEFLASTFTWTHERIFANDHPETWFLAARAWPKSANPEQQGKTLSGLHSKYVLALIDESGAIPETVLRAAEQALSTGPVFGKILQGGNTLSRDGMLYAAASRLRHLWHIIVITGDPDDPRRSPRIDIEWARQQIATYGRDNPWVQAYILGVFPPNSLNALLGDEEVLAAMRLDIPESVYDWAQKRIGIDVARFGDDRTVLFPRQGRRAFAPRIMRHIRDSAVSTDIATAALQMQADLRSEALVMDATGGWAAGARDVLVSAGQSPVSVQFHAPSGDQKYQNRRAEMWFRMAEWVKAGGWLPNIPELVAELTTPTYTYGVAGKFLIEPKDKVKERLGRSPDLADALALTFAIPERAPATARVSIPVPSGGSWRTA
jgi:phage terminase large subunit